MKKTLLLLAGYPGTGKSYLSNMIMKRFGGVLVSQDDIKEALWDEVGFSNLDEKETTTNQSRELYYEAIEKAMQKGLFILSDYPFSEKQKPLFEKLVARYHYQIITIRLLGDLDVLFARQQKRDLQASRHLGHMMTHYHNGDVLHDRSQADLLLTYDEFVERCTTRGYETFSMGYLISVDVSDFDQVDYDEIMNKVSFYLN